MNIFDTFLSKFPVAFLMVGRNDLPILAVTVFHRKLVVHPTNQNEYSVTEKTGKNDYSSRLLFPLKAVAGRGRRPVVREGWSRRCPAVSRRKLDSYTRQEEVVGY